MHTHAFVGDEGGEDCCSIREVAIEIHGPDSHTNQHRRSLNSQPPHLKSHPHKVFRVLGVLGLAALLASTGRASTNVYLLDVPDYDWFYGCMGTASGNLLGFWDRHGFPDFYTGPANGGVAPLTTDGANAGIISLWASKAGRDGRPITQLGHVDDYYVSYEATGPDPYVTAGRPEHLPDCVADFIGMDQLKWTNLANECRGNIDGYCFVYWETNGLKRVNYAPTDADGTPVRDVQSGLRAWTQYRGYDCTVFTQLTDFNPTKPADQGFTFADLKAEIDSGYPVLLFLQNFGQHSRTIGSAINVNPPIHSMLAYGYYIADSGTPYVRYMTSWASGPTVLSLWGPQIWQASLPVRGVIGYHPLPKIRQCSMSAGNLLLQWDGPAADLYDSSIGTITRVHGYVVEMSPSITPPNFSDVSPVLTTNVFTIQNAPTPAFFRVRLVKP
jgi:hypothetical protein